MRARWLKECLAEGRQLQDALAHRIKAMQSSHDARTYEDGVRDERARVVSLLLDLARKYSELGASDEADALAAAADDIACGDHEAGP